MRLEIDHPALYADGLFVCYVGAGNGRNHLELKSGAVRTSYSHKFGEVLPFVDDLEWWIGAHRECDIILAKVLGGNGPIPCGAYVKRLVALVEQAESIGERVTISIRHG